MRNILSQPWAIDPGYVEGVMPFLVALINGDNPAWQKEESLTVMLVVAGADQAVAATGGSDAIPPGSIAVVRLRGPMLKNDQFCGPVGTATIAARLKDLSANPNVDGILLHVDSPGGSVDGTEELARTYASIKKPKVTFVDGVMASAAMWVGSGGDRIVMGGETAMAGSIGTMTSVTDLQPILEKAGAKFHRIKATRSADKNADFESAMKGEYDGIRNNMLNPLNQVFTNAIEKNRAGKIDLKQEDVLTGKMYIGKAAVKAGLADSVGNFESALQTVRQLISDKKSKKTSMSLKTKYPKMAAVASFAENAEALENGGVELSATEMQAVEDYIAANSNAAALQTQVTALTGERNQARTELATATESLTTANSTIANLQAEVKKLGGKTDAPEETERKKDPAPDSRKRSGKNSMDAYAESMGVSRD